MSVYIFSVSLTFCFSLFKSNSRTEENELYTHNNHCPHVKIGMIKKISSQSLYFFKFKILTPEDAAWSTGLSHPPSSMLKYTQTTPPSTVACVINSSSSNWLLVIDVSKYRQNALVWNAQSHKCQFSIQQCLPNTHTFPQQCVQKKKEHACFPTLKEKSPGWQANIQRAPLHTQRFRSDLAIIDHPISPQSLPLSLGLPHLLIADWEKTGGTRTLQSGSQRRKSWKCIQYPLLYESWTM